MLRQLDGLPEGLLETPATGLEERLGGPTLIRLPGRRSPDLFVAVLMHGNETTGWDAVRRLLRDYQPGGGAQPLPRGLTLLIGNVAAAAQGVRRLPHQPDYNRIWPGGESEDLPERRMMAEVTRLLEQRGLFAAIDIHNNTGLNPHYGCVNVIDHRYLHLATLFSRTVVYFIRPRGVLSLALAPLCPSVTLECGQPNQPHGVDHAVEYLNACLHLSAHPEHPVAAHDLDLFHTVARVFVAPEVRFGFDQPDADLNLLSDIEYFNFRELPKGTALGSVQSGQPPLMVRGENGEDLWERFFRIQGNELRLNNPTMPSMLTRNQAVIRQDCLCYLMERYTL